MLVRVIFTILMIFSRCAFSSNANTDSALGENPSVAALSYRISEKSVVIYDGKTRLGKFDNLITDESSLSSNIVKILGGGLAIYVDSNGSRNKFHLIVPIYQIGKNLYIKCVYKTVYDSVDEKLSVGASCKNQNLDQFNLASVINQKDLLNYESNHGWLASLPLKNCGNPVGLVYGTYYVIRCEKNRKAASKGFATEIFQKSGEMVFSVDGYEFIPTGNNNDFVLNSDTLDKTIYFQGSLGCLSSGSMRMLSSSEATIGENAKIRYSVENTGDCYSGFYSYSKNGVPITLIGQRDGKNYYLAEHGKDRVITGLFILNKLDKLMSGIWIRTKSGQYLTVR
jgi:hypothetical protein